MTTRAADSRVRALAVARDCVAMGARLTTAARVTGVSTTVLGKLFQDLRVSLPRGRRGGTLEWFRGCDLSQQVEASLFCTLFMRYLGRADCAGAALTGAVAAYRATCGGPPQLNFDRCFELARAVTGVWSGAPPVMAMSRCAACACLSLTRAGDESTEGLPCAFCKVRQRYRSHSVLQRRFPPLPDQQRSAARAELERLACVLAGPVPGRGHERRRAP